MRLKRVELVGFKSFMDKTVLDFRDGITCILGPNGCGKSNVVDAVRWVLGEQRARQLRGDKMEDVIFKGSKKRKALGTAEVQLVFDNSDGTLNVPFSEVAIGRRVDRSGHSDYLMNRAPCRLKDIRDLFYDTGVGNNAYSVIEQEIIGQVLDPSEQKVRTILEEGSGIVRYKIKRKEALRKLDLTERDLLRVEDIIEEIGKQVRSLARQVGKARRHKKLFGEVRALEMLRAESRARVVREELAQIAERTQALQAEGSGDDAELARHRAEVERIRPALEDLEGTRRERAHQLSTVEAELNKLEGELLVLREKVDSGTRRTGEIEAELTRGRGRATELAAERAQAEEERTAVLAKLGEHEQQVAQLQQAFDEATRAFTTAQAQLKESQQLSLGFLQEEAEHKTEIKAAETRLENLDEQKAQVTAALEEAEGKLATLRSELGEAEQRIAEIERERGELEGELTRAAEEVEIAEAQVQAAREAREEAADELARVESRHEIAQRIAQEYEGYRAGAASLLRDESLRGRVRGALAEHLRVQDGYEAAFELLFGEDADALLVEELGDARALAERLAREDLGTASFLAGSGQGTRQADLPEGLPGRPALELLRAEGDVHGFVSRWLARVRVVEGAQEAIDAAMEHAHHGVSFLAREGLFVRFDGLVRGGAGARRQLSIFGRGDQVDELSRKLGSLRQVVAERQQVQHDRQKDLEAARQRVEERRAQLSALGERLSRQNQEVAGRRSVLAREEQAREQLVARRASTDQALAQVMASIESLRGELGRHGEGQQQAQARVEELSAEVPRLEAARDAAATTLQEARLSLTHDRGTERELETRLSRVRSMEEEIAQRVERLVAEQGSLATNLDQWREGIEARTGRVGELHDDREARQEALRESHAAIDARRAELEEHQEAMRQVAERQRRKEAALHELDSRQTRLEIQMETLAERIQEKFHCTVEEGLAQLDEEQLPDDLERDDEGRFSLAQVEELLRLRAEKLEKLGPVNFVALEEYDEKKQRLEFLEQQRDDLLSSKEDLLQAIDKINRTARQLFRDTYEAVRANFQEIFRTLFEGGEADLVLHKTDDPLEADIEVVARPKGKKIDSVTLLSGGERALTALALLFAVYLIKPSPFCLLDEVDAPLDDVNVGRFVRLLERFQDTTQFIVITHNKLTMEAGDHLYGVTMQESGVSRLVSVSFDQLAGDDPLKALEEVAAEGAEPEKAAVNRLGRSQHAKVLPADDDSDGEEPGPAGNGLKAMSGEA